MVKALLMSYKKIGVSDTVGQYLLVVRKPDLDVSLAGKLSLQPKGHIKGCAKSMASYIRHEDFRPPP